MAVAVSPLQEHEIPRFARIELEAFSSHPRLRMLWPRGFTEDLYAFYEASKVKSFHNPECRFMKAVDSETGAIVACSQWTFALDPATLAAEEPVDPHGLPPSDWPVDGNWEMRRFYDLNLEKWKKEYLTGKAYIQLDILVTSPEFHRRGMGKALLSWGVDHADKLGVMMCLEATPAGLSLYKRLGFREADVIKADMKQFGWHEPYDEEAAKRVWMIREPQTHR